MAFRRRCWGLQGHWLQVIKERGKLARMEAPAELAALVVEADEEELMELSALEKALKEKITFGIDSGAALTVISSNVASDYPSRQGPKRQMRDCQGREVKDLGMKDLEMKSKAGVSFARVTVASVAKNLLAVSSLVRSGHEVVFQEEGSYIRHRMSGRVQKMREVNGVYEIDIWVKSSGFTRQSEQ